MNSERVPIWRSLRWRILAIFTMSVVAMVATTAFVSVELGTRATRRTLNEHLTASLQSGSKAITRWLEDQSNAGIAMAERPAIREALMNDTARRRAEELCAAYMIASQDVANVLLLDRDGVVIADGRGGRFERFDLSGQPLWKRLTQSAEPVHMGNVATAAGTQRIAMPIAVRITTPEGDLLGAFVISVDWSSFVRRLRLLTAAEGGTLLVLNRDDRVIEGPDPAMLLRSLPADHVVNAADGSGVSRVESAKGWKLIGRSRIDSTGWTIAVVRDEDEMLAAAHATRRTVYMTGLVTLVLGFLVLLASLTSATRSLKAMTRWSQRATGEDLHGGAIEPELADMPVFERRDELGILARSFVKLQDTTRSRLEALRQSEERLRTVVQTMPVMVDAFDDDMNLIVWNSECERVTGYAADDMVGNPDAMKLLYPDPEYRKWVHNTIDRQPGDFRNIESEVTCKNGETRTISWSNLSTTHPIAGWSSWAIGVDITERERTERALRRSESLLSKSQAMAHIGSWEFEVDGDQLTWSDEVYRMFGVEPDSKPLDYADFVTCVHPDDRDMVNRAYLGSIREQRDNYEVEHRIVRQNDGQVRIVHERCEHIKDEAGHVIRSIGMVQDITAYRHVQREYETLFHEMLNGFALHEIICNDQGKPIDYRFLAVNPAFERLTGLHAADLIGQTVLQIMPDIEPRWIETYGRVALTGEPTRFEEHSGELGKTFIVTAFQPAPNQFACIFDDISERKRAEDALRDSEQHYRALVESSPLPIIVHRTGHILFANDKAVVLHGAAHADQLTGRHLLDFIHADDADNFSARLQSESLLQSAPMQLRIVRLDGQVAEIEATGMPTTFNKQPARIVILQDVTERNRMEQLLRQAQKMEAVGQLAGGVAHDFNNILQAILGCTELAINDTDAAHPAYPLLEQTMAAGNRAKGLVRQLLAFSRRQVLQMEELDINEVIAELMKMLRRVIGEHITLELLPGHELAPVRADRGQLGQILMNLCVNARDAMPEGGTIKIETQNVELDKAYCELNGLARAGDYVAINVTDDGCGMSEDTKSQIFEPFFTTKDVGKGTGLGLATVFGLVRQHGGQIEVESQPDRGSTFRILLPATSPSLPTATTKEDQSVAGGRERILLAEDDSMVLDVCRDILGKAGYEVLTATNGQEAIDRFNQHADDIDLALLDVVMPKLSGRAVYDHIKAVRPRTPVLFASGYNTNAVHTNFILHEGLHFIQKPYMRDELLRKIRETIDEPSAAESTVE